MGALFAKIDIIILSDLVNHLILFLKYRYVCLLYKIEPDQYYFKTYLKL